VENKNAPLKREQIEYVVEKVKEGIEISR